MLLLDAAPPGADLRKSGSFQGGTAPVSPAKPSALAGKSRQGRPDFSRPYGTCIAPCTVPSLKRLG